MYTCCTMPLNHTYKYQKGLLFGKDDNMDMRSTNHQAQRCAGTRVLLFGWLSRGVSRPHYKSSFQQKNYFDVQMRPGKPVELMDKTTVNRTYSQTIYHLNVSIMPTICHILKYNWHEGNFPCSQTHICNSLGRYLQAYTLYTCIYIYIYIYVYRTVYLHIYLYGLKLAYRMCMNMYYTNMLVKSFNYQFPIKSLSNKKHVTYYFDNGSILYIYIHDAETSAPSKHHDMLFQNLNSNICAVEKNITLDGLSPCGCVDVKLV